MIIEFREYRSSLRVQMTTVLEHPPTPPMSSNEAGYSQYSFNHLHEAVAKAQYGTHNGPFDTSVLQLPSNHRSFFEDSTPTMSPQEAFSDACGNSYFTPPLNNARYEDLHFRNGQLYEKVRYPPPPLPPPPLPHPPPLSPPHEVTFVDLLRVRRQAA